MKSDEILAEELSHTARCPTLGLWNACGNRPELEKCKQCWLDWARNCRDYAKPKGSEEK